MILRLFKKNKYIIIKLYCNNKDSHNVYRRDGLLRLGASHGWSVDPIDLAVEAAGIAKIVTGAIPSPQRRHIGRAVGAFLRFRRHNGIVKGLVGTGKRKGPRRGWSARGDAVSTARVQLHVGGVGDGDGGDARITRDVFQSWGRGCATAWPVRIARGLLHVLIRRWSCTVQCHLRARRTGLLVMQWNSSSRGQG